MYNLIKPVTLTDQELLTKYIQALTHSGLSDLDKIILGKLKTICRKNPKLLDSAYLALMTHLKKNHAEVRLAAFQLLKELFSRSPNFRILVVRNLEGILELTAGINTKVPLPAPKDAAKKLKELSLTTIHQWKGDYGQKYKQIVLCYDYLTRCKNVEFEALVREIDQREAARIRNEADILRAKKEIIETITKEYNDMLPEANNTIEAVYNCISLLLPPPENFFVPSEDAEDSFLVNSAAEDNPDFNMRLFGINPSYNLVINVNLNEKVQVKRTDENSAIIENLNDSIRLIRKRHLPAIKKWEDGLERASLDTDYKGKVRELKEKLDTCLNKKKGLVITGSDDTDSDSDCEMVEVTKEGFEPHVLPIFKEKSAAEVKIDCLPSSSVTVNAQSKPCRDEETFSIKPSTSKSEEGETHDGEKEKSRKERLMEVAPKIPYDVDLYHWEDENLQAPKLISIKMGNPKFWGCGDAGDVDELDDPAGVAALRTRVIEYTGQFEPITRSCRAPLPSGKLCPRMDRERCPFHGKIVPRDEMGKCLNEEPTPSTSTAAKETEEVESVPDWQDPVLLAQLKAATGIDLKMPDKRKKNKKKPRPKKSTPNSAILDEIRERKFPGITDLKKRLNDPKTRLKKKLFNRSTMKRVAAAIDKVERRRHNDKFGDQFNYAHN